MTDKQTTDMLNTLSLFTGNTVFTLAGKVNRGAALLKTEDEKREAQYTRRYQLRELKNKDKQ